MTGPLHPPVQSGNWQGCPRGPLPTGALLGVLSGLQEPRPEAVGSCCASLPAQLQQEYHQLRISSHVSSGMMAGLSNIDMSGWLRLKCGPSSVWEIESFFIFGGWPAGSVVGSVVTDT
ncbi:MAG: hypothetical protein FRX49_03487 [Trebouxia sp. A1-2]|nr:MAG: hypothetical protein FRX49_03487 [Trebouxia sp. A1-2]